MIQSYLGFDSDYIIIGMAAVVIILLILLIANIVQIKQLKKRYKIFMKGSTARSLEDTLIERLELVDDLVESNATNERNIDIIFKRIANDYQKLGIVKYDAFNEMGGKLSFSLALLNEKNNGFIINAVHSREGCYTYVKEIIDGRSVINLSDEEIQALDRALEGGI